MEIVKRLEGSEPEEYDVHFDEENPEEEKEKKSILLVLISLVIITIVGYFGFKSFNSQSTDKVEKEHLIAQTATSIVNESKVSERNNSSSTIKEETKKNSEPDIQKSEPTKEKVAVYTEELAQSIKPTGTQEIATPKIETQKIPTQKVTVEKDISSNKITIYTEELSKEVKPKETTQPVITKKVPPKKTTPEKVVIKKSTPKTSKRKQRIITVKKGDTLALISKKYYGNSMEFKRIIRANKSLKSHKTSLKLGQEIIVPYLPKDKQRRFVIVKKGYSLAYISKKFYGTIGKVQEIVDANSDIKNKKSTLRIGQKVYVPRLK